MAYLSTCSCLGCGTTFSTYGGPGRSACYCAACQKATATRRLFGEGETADCWIAMLYPESFTQEHRVAENRQEIADAFSRVIASRDGDGYYEFSDS